MLREPLTMAQERSVTFVQLTDSHLFDSGKRGTPEEKEVEKLSTGLAWKWALGEVTRLVTSGEHIDFVVFTGDLGLERACPDGRMACDAWETAVNRVYEDLKALPIKRVFIVRGNNDLVDEDPTPERRRLYTDFVLQVSGKLKEAAKTSEVAELVDLTPENPVQPADVDGIRLVGLDSSSFKNTPKNSEKSDPCMDRVDATEWDKVAASRSSVYQKRELDRVDHLTRDSGPALIFTHIPDLADPFRVRNCKTRFASWSLVSADRDQWKQIASRQSVIALFAGHFHDDDRDTYRRPYRLLASPEIDPVVAEKTYVAPPLAAKFQVKPLQARGFLLASMQGGRVIRAEFHWFNAVEPAAQSAKQSDAGKRENEKLEDNESQRLGCSVRELLAVIISWPFVGLLLLLYLVLGKSAPRPLAELLKPFKNVKLFGAELSLGEELARSAAEAFEAYGKQAGIEYDRKVEVYDVKRRMGDVIERHLSKSFNNILDVKGLRCTLHVPDVLFADTLYQLIDYYAGKGGKGRRKSIRFGIIGKTWRLSESQVSGNVSTKKRDLILEWGMTMEEAAAAGQGRPSFVSVLLLDENNTQAGIFFMDSTGTNAFTSPPLLDWDKIINVACKTAGLTKALADLNRELREHGPLVKLYN